MHPHIQRDTAYPNDVLFGFLLMQWSYRLGFVRLLHVATVNNKNLKCSLMATVKKKSSMLSNCVIAQDTLNERHTFQVNLNSISLLSQGHRDRWFTDYIDRT